MSASLSSTSKMLNCRASLGIYTPIVKSSISLQEIFGTPARRLDITWTSKKRACFAKYQAWFNLRGDVPRSPPRPMLWRVAGVPFASAILILESDAQQEVHFIEFG